MMQGTDPLKCKFIFTCILRRWHP